MIRWVFFPLLVGFFRKTPINTPKSKLYTVFNIYNEFQIGITLRIHWVIVGKLGFYQINYNWYNEPFAVSRIDLFILRHAWLNLWDKRMLLAESTRLLSFWIECCIFRKCDWNNCNEWDAISDSCTIGIFSCILASLNHNQKKVSFVKSALGFP